MILYFITFIPLKSLLLRSHLVSKTKSLRKSKLVFQPRLKFRFDYKGLLQIKFISPFETGLGFPDGLNCGPG